MISLERIFISAAVPVNRKEYEENTLKTTVGELTIVGVLFTGFWGKSGV